MFYLIGIGIYIFGFAVGILLTNNLWEFDIKHKAENKIQLKIKDKLYTIIK